MSTPAPTTEQLQAAFARVRGDDWPATLQELHQAAARLGIVTAAAKAMARGERVLARESLEPCAACSAPPARVAASRPIPMRRHGDTTPDLKRLAAGDRDD